MSALRKTKSIIVAAIVSISMINAAYADELCTTAVSSVLDNQRQAYIAASGDLADQNFSRRPGSFASTTCLDNLMKGSGLDIFFKPPSLDTIIGMVKNLACDQASQIFDQLLGGSGVNLGGALNPGELIKGVNLGAHGSQFSPFQSGGSAVSGSIDGLFR